MLTITCPYCGKQIANDGKFECCYTFGPQEPNPEETTTYASADMFGGLCEKCYSPNDTHGNCTNIDCAYYMPF